MEDVTKAMQDLRKAQRVNILKSFGVTEDETFDREAIIKGLNSENPFERAAAQDALEKANISDIEKSDIMEAISYSEEFKFKKTGKEIKEQIAGVILPALNADLAVKKAESDKLLKECGTAPTNDVCRWWLNGLNVSCDYKVYDWEETYFRDQPSVSSSIAWEQPDEAPKYNCAASKEEACSRREYNDAVRVVCNILVDIAACSILTKNLKDDDSVKLSPRQLAVFKMD